MSRIVRWPLLASFVVVACGGASEPPRTSPRAAKVASREKPRKNAKPASASSSVDFDGDGFPVTAPSATAVASAKASPDDFKPAAPAVVDRVLFDPTTAHSETIIEVLTLSDSRRDKAEEKRVLDLVFPKRLAKADDCPKKVGGTLEYRRTQGMIAPLVVEWVDGSFSAPKASERLVVIYVGECNAGSNASRQLVVLKVGTSPFRAAGAVVASASILDQGIAALVDMDGDGKSEIILDSNDYFQQHTESARLVRFDGSTLTEVASFGQVMLDTCAYALDGGKKEYTVVHVQQKAGEPKITTERKTQACR
jgi:hypothetical protein